MGWLRGKRSEVCRPEVNIRVHIDTGKRSGPRRRRVQPDVQSESSIIIPTDLMFAAWRQLFPAERMVVFGGRKSASGLTISSVADVTEPHPSVAHVRASAERMTNCLVDFERTGAHLAIWMHSHPGEGMWSTFPSEIDRNQDLDLRRHYSDRLVGIITVRDGWLRVWGEAVDRSALAVRWHGQGVQPTGDANVFRLQLS